MERCIEQIIIIGSGNWGLALANLFSRSKPVRVWTEDSETLAKINSSRDNPGHFFKYPLSSSLKFEEKYKSKIDSQKTLIVIAVPSGQVRNVARELGDKCLDPLILSVSKGFDPVKQLTMSQVIGSEIPEATVAVLTGPTIANEVAEGKPTKAVIACDNLMDLILIKKTLENDVIYFEVSSNPVHHEICAALKGIVAIAVGISDGLGLGANAKGVIMAEGIKELATVAAFFDIPEISVHGFSGAGDLIATCISSESRNVRLGKYLVEYKDLKTALNKVGMAVEGVAMSNTIEMLWSLDVSIPLFNTVNRIIQGQVSDIRQEISKLIKEI